jgi:hypothetical protein
MKLQKKAYMAIMLIAFIVEPLTLTNPNLIGTTQKSFSETLALWHFDEVYTPDATGRDHIGILGGTPPPTLVEGKFGKALDFDGKNFVYVPFSPNLYAADEITIEAWIYVKGFRDTTYNNVIVICQMVGLAWQTTTRICGLAVTPENSDKPSHGFLRGYVYTDKEHFNEIVTTEPVIPLGKWVHVAFTRSLATGMHLYIDGQEKEVEVTWGVRNPTGKIVMGTAIFFGHDAEIIIDEPRICDIALEPSQFLLSNPPAIITSRTEIDIGPNLKLAIIVAALIFATAWLLRRVIQTWGMSRLKG